mgnify:FL=1
MELPEGTILAHVLDAKENIPMQFGREVCRNNVLNKCLLYHLYLMILECIVGVMGTLKKTFFS